jgi:acetate kinase
MNILVLNCGSSTVKFQIIETDAERIEQDADRRLARGIVERVGGQALIALEAQGQPKERSAEPLRDHRAAIDHILRWIVSRASKIDHITSLADIHAVGHRVVHGGERFRKSVRIDESVLEEIEDCIELAPLHNPANLKIPRSTPPCPSGPISTRSRTSCIAVTRSADTGSTAPRTGTSPIAIG